MNFISKKSNRYLTKHDEILFIQELERDYVLIDSYDVLIEYGATHPVEIDIILKDQYGSTLYLDMNLNKKDFKDVIKCAEKYNCWFGILKSSIKQLR